MNSKFAGLATQLRELRKRFESMDTSKEDPAKVRELRDLIKDLEEDLAAKKKQKEERAKVKSEAPKVEAAPQIPEVVKESAPTPTEVTKESTVEKFAIDSKVEPIRGTPGSWGTVIREAGINGDPLVYIKWNEGHLKEAHGEYGAYYPSDLKLKAEVVAEAKDPTAYVPREQLYDLEADLKSNYEKQIQDLKEEIQTATDKGEGAWIGRLEEKLAKLQKAYDERFNNEKHAEDENGSGGTDKLKVYDLNPAYDKDPQEKATGYGGDRTYGWQTAPVRDDMTSLTSAKECYLEDCKGTLHKEDGKEVCDTCHGEWGRNAHKEASLRSNLKESGATVGWNVYLNGKKIDKVFYVPTATAEEIKKGLVDHDNYDPGITVKKEASLKVADLDLNSIEKRYAIYVDNVKYPAARTLTRAKAERLAKEKFPEQLAAGKVEIKREDYKEAELKPMNINVGSNFYNVNPLPKPSTEEFAYDVIDSMGTQLFKITAKQELDQEHLSKIIEVELGNKKKSSLAKLTANLAFLKKGSLVSIVAEDRVKGQVKFAALDNSLRGWAPIAKFAAIDVPEAHLIDHEGHKDEVLADNGGREILVTCPANSINVEWRTIEVPPATPESLNPDVASLKKADIEEEISEEIQPDANDIYISYDRNGKAIASSPEYGVIASRAVGAKIEPLYEDIRDWMDNHKFWPSVWSVSDHGNVHPAESYYGWLKIQHPEKYASLSKDAHIRHEDGKWVIYSHDYKKKLGTYDSKEEALKRLRAIEYFKSHKGSMQPLSKKEASAEVPMPKDKCEECGKELGPEAFLSKWPVCGKCTKKRHEKAVGKRADQEISLEQQVQSFRDRMNAVTERLSNPPAKTADLETTQDLTNVDVKDLSSAILHTIDLLESKVGEISSVDPELHPMLEDLENKVYEIEMKLGIKPDLPEHEKLEPEHKQFIEEEVEKESDMSNVPPSENAPQGFRWAFEPTRQEWIMVADPSATGTGTGGSY